MSLSQVPIILILVAIVSLSQFHLTPIQQHLTTHSPITLHQLPPSERPLNLSSQLKENPFLDHPAQLDQQLCHFIIIVDPGLFALEKFNSQHPAESFLIEDHFLLLVQLQVHLGDVVLVVDNA
jgi:hypothetical protein